MSIRLLFLTAETCPTFRADVNVLFGKYLPRHGVYSDIVAGRTPGAGEDVQWGGGETFLCNVDGGAAKKHIKTLLHGMRHLFRADRSRYQAIQVRDMPVLAAVGLLAARIKGLPFYYWMSYPMPEGQIALARERGLSAGLMKFLYPWVSGRIGGVLLYRVVLRLADHVFVQSDRMKEDLTVRGFSVERMTPVPMAVDLDDVQVEEIPPAGDSRLKGHRVLVYLGTLDRPRRIEKLFDMLVEIKQRIPEALLVLVGDTEDSFHRGWLKEQAQKAGVADDVVWTGWLPMKEGWRYVRAAEVALSPIPRGELLDVGSPTKVPEYLALGVPVVCNDNPDQMKIISESKTGLCVPFTPKDFANAAIAILGSEWDMQNAMVARGRAYVMANRDYKHLSRWLAGLYLGS